jgi:hypothetical protein
VVAAAGQSTLSYSQTVQQHTWNNHAPSLLGDHILWISITTASNEDSYNTHYTSLDL